MNKIFISYSTHDLSFANNIYLILKKHGYEPWMAQRDIPSGSVYPEEIVKAIKSSSKAIFIISKDSLKSKHCYSEIGICFDNNIDIIPYRIDMTPYPHGFEYYLNNFEWIGGSNDIKKAEKNIIESLNNRSVKKTPRKITLACAIGAIAILTVGLLFFFRKRNDLPYCGALHADYGKCLSLSDYNIIKSSTGDYSFAYPKNFFKTSDVTEDGYYFKTADGETTLTVTREEEQGYSLEKVEKIYSEEKEKYDFTNEINGVHVISDEENARGWSHAVIGGTYLDNPDFGAYVIVAATSDYIYTFRFDYEVLDQEEYYNEQNYVMDCMYRYCSYSGSNYEPREFSSFLNDRKQAK